MEKIGNRFIEIFIVSLAELANFLKNYFGDQGTGYSRDTLPNIPLELRRSTVLMHGLPFSAMKTDILKFFNGYNLKDGDVHMLPSHSGKFSGNALVTFENEIEAQRAIKNKNLSHMQNRYIELNEYR